MKFLIALLASVLPLMAQSPFDVSLAQVPYMAASGTIPGIFVDSFAGSDSNTGTSNSPFASALKVNQVLGFSASTNIFFKRGGKYGRFQIPSNSIVDAYGTANYAPDIYGGVTNSKPIFSGAVHIPRANISKTGGQTIVYQATLTPQTDFAAWPFTNTYANIISSNVLMLWQDGVRVGARWEANGGSGGVASVDGGAGRFYYDTSTKIIYFSTLDGSDPTATGFYEASFDTLALHGGDAITVKNCIAEKSYAYNSDGSQGYGILAMGSGLFEKCTARNGWNHNAGVANSVVAGLLTFKDCKAGDMETSGGVSFIAYKDGASSSDVVFTNCLSYNYDYDKGSGFYAHDAGGSPEKVHCYVVNCQAYKMAIGFANNSTRTPGWYGNTAIYCASGAGAYGTFSLDRFTNYFSPYSATTAVEIDGDVSVFNSKFVVTNEAFNVFIFKSAASSTIRATNNLIANGGSGSSSVFYAVASTTWHFWSNNIDKFSYSYRADGTPSSGDYNNYHSIAVMGDITSGNWNTVSQWKTAQSPKDANCTTSDPAYAGGFYTYTLVDPTGGDAN